MCLPFRSYCLLAVFIGISLGGCTAPTLEKPLTDEDTSVSDLRLLGHWQLVPAGNSADPPPRFVIGRAKDKKNTLELAFAELGTDGHVELVRLSLFTTTIGPQRYVTTHISRAGKSEEGYALFRYQYAEEAAGPRGDDQIQIFRLSTTAIAAAIDNKQLAGTVVRSEKPVERTADNPFKQEFRSIRITAGPDELTKFLKEQGGTCFDGEVWTLRRAPPIFK